MSENITLIPERRVEIRSMSGALRARARIAMNVGEHVVTDFTVSEHVTSEDLRELADKIDALNRNK